MSCVNSSCCDCNGCCEPISASGPAIDAATCATQGTDDTANALITQGGSLLGTAIKEVGCAQRTATKAKAQIATTSVHSVTLLVIAIVAIIGFVIFGSRRLNA